MHTRISVLLIISLLLSMPVFGATCYVDPTLSADCDGTNYHYVPTNAEGERRVAGPGAKATNTLQEMIYGTLNTGTYKSNNDQIAQAGDTIYIRGGTYTEDYGQTLDCGAAMAISHGLNGSAWTEGNYTTIASYPGEWAIMDGQNTAKFVFGWGDDDTSTGDTNTWYYRYILIERIAVTRASIGGLAWIGGPVKVRYCSFYENGLTSSYTNKGGIYSYVPQNSTVEYCNFYNNSGTDGHNASHIIFFSDYNGRSGFNFTYSMHGNKVQYCYFHGSSTATGIHDKAEQYLGPNSGTPGMMTDMTYKTYGNEYCYNIFEDCTRFAIMARHDFEQIHHNISECAISGEDGSEFPAVHYKCLYNNTMKGNFISETIGYSLSTYNPLDFNLRMLNNIVSTFSVADYSPAFGIGVNWLRTCAGSYTWTDTIVDRNFIHNPQGTYADTRHYGLPDSYNCKSTRWVSTATFNSDRGTTNYTNKTSGLFAGASGADAYKTVGSFVLTGSTTIANGGYNNSHPYLSGVTIPDYVGATDPDDIEANDWVTGVLGLNATYFTSVTGGTDPDWIAGSESGEPAPSTPSITGVMTGIIR